ncbi:hypothetical protein LSAT2_030078 [Lamellibrachia satsuma]|nr:hypothetical protein LSAT2_030078 [Lamellibrachia satsuma]
MCESWEWVPLANQRLDRLHCGRSRSYTRFKTQQGNMVIMPMARCICLLVLLVAQHSGAFWLFSPVCSGESYNDDLQICCGGRTHNLMPGWKCCGSFVPRPCGALLLPLGEDEDASSYHRGWKESRK